MDLGVLIILAILLPIIIGVIIAALGNPNDGRNK